MATIDDIRERACELLDDAGFGFGDDTIAITRETIDDFVAVWGAGVQDRDLDGTPHRVWRNVQPGGKGTPRGTLVVMDFGDYRVANFC